MARIDIDLSTARDPREAIPNGTYTLEIQAAELKESKSGNPMLVVQSSVIGSDEFDGKMIFDYAVLNTQGGKFRARQYAEAAGADLAGLDTDELHGIEFEAEITTETDDEYGDQNRIHRILLDD